MKKVLIALTIAAACCACGGSNDEKKPVSNNDSNANSQIGGDTSAKTSAASGSTAAATPAAPAKDAKALIEGSDCRTCHKDDAKLIGPAYQDVAKKYEATDANVEMLADKVMKGGTGVWGQIPMAAHPTISKDDAVAMVKYILSMKK